jgi:hypothetical protein
MSASLELREIGRKDGTECARAIEAKRRYEHEMQANAVRTRVLKIVDFTETQTYLRITGAPLCCCCAILTDGAV